MREGKKEGKKRGGWKDGGGREGREEEDVERTTKVSDFLPLSRRLATRHVILASRWSLGRWSLLIRSAAAVPAASEWLAGWPDSLPFAVVSSVSVLSAAGGGALGVL